LKRNEVDFQFETESEKMKTKVEIYCTIV